MSRSALPWLGLAIRLAGAAVWLFAGGAKLLDLDSFRLQVDAYYVLPHVLVAPFAYALPLIEVVLGLYLLVGALVRPVAMVSCALMAIFIVAQLQAWSRGLSIDCGCFGTTVTSKVGLTTVLRDAALGIPFYVMAWRPARKWSVDEALLGRQDEFVGGTAVEA